MRHLLYAGLTLVEGWLYLYNHSPFTAGCLGFVLGTWVMVIGHDSMA